MLGLKRKVPQKYHKGTQGIEKLKIRKEQSGLNKE